MRTQEETEAWLKSLDAAARDDMYQHFCFAVLAATEDEKADISTRRRELRELGDLFDFPKPHRDALMNQAAERRRDILSFIESTVPA